MTAITDALPKSTVDEEFCFRKGKDAEQFKKQDLTPSSLSDLFTFLRTCPPLFLSAIFVAEWRTSRHSLPSVLHIAK